MSSLMTVCTAYVPIKNMFRKQRYEKNLNNVAIRGNNMSYLQNLTLGNRCIVSGKMASRGHPFQ